nr:integrase, catalytic region, zinc finger, CCHC-type, peptidase aspartic, catalytic [Tanacetum cinerariifolium]
MDSIIPLGQKNTLAEYMILFGADNRPPMLDKDLYDSWKSRMEHNGMTRTKKYVELSAAEKIQADCDLKATNSILKGTSLTKQKREYKLYDTFDKFTYIKEESLYKYYLRSTHLINDMNIYNMKMEEFQVNTKFLNSLPPGWRDDQIACLNKAMTFLTAVASSRYKSNVASSGGNNASGQAMVVKCYNCQEKAMLAKAREAGQILDEEQLAFPADPGVPDGQAIQPQGFYDNIHKQALDYQNLFYLKKAQRIKPTFYDGVVISNKHVAMPVIDNEETLILEEDFKKRFVPQQELLAGEVVWYQMLNHSTKSYVALPIKIEAPKELLKVSLVNECPKKLKLHLANFDKVVKIRITHNARTEGEWGFEHTKAVFNNEIILFLKSLKDIFNVFDRDLLDEIIEVQIVFDQMDAAIQQSSVDKQRLKISNIELLLEIDRLLQQLRSQDALLTVMSSMSLIDESVNMDRKRNESSNKCFNLEAELLKSQNAHNDILKMCSQFEKHCISLESSIQLNQEISQKDESCDNQNALEITKFFKKNDLKAQLQDKDTTIFEQTKAKQPLDNTLDFACKHAQRIQELLVYVPDTCPNAINLSAKNFAVTPKNKVKKGLKCSTSNCDSRPSGNKKNDRILQTPSRNMKNKVEAQPSNVNKKNSVVELIRNVDVKHSVLKTNSDPICDTYSRCSKHMTGNRSQLMNCVSKFLGTVRFGNDHIARIMGYGDYQLGNVTISRVYYVEGLEQNLFSAGQFYGEDLKAAFQKNTCFIRNLEGVDLLSESHDTNLYIISLDGMLKTSKICLLSKALKTKSWLWHLEKSKKSSHQPKAEDTNQEKLYLLLMDLCGLMRVVSINGKRKVTILNGLEEESDWDDDERKLEWENPFAAKHGEDHTILHLSKEEENNNDLPYPKFQNFKKVAVQIIKQHEEHVFPSISQEDSTESYQPPHDSIMGPSVYQLTQHNPQPFYRLDYQFGYPQGVMLVLPADPSLWSELISRWESITINRLNNQTWSDNKANLAFVENLLGESEKLIWQQWRTVFPEAYFSLEAITDEPQNITSQARQLILLEDPYRGSIDEQDKAYRDLDRITCEETKNLWLFLEDFRQLATKSGRLSKQGNIARSAVYQELDLDDNWDIVSADFDDSSVYRISEGEGDTNQNISVMVQDTPVEEIAFMAIEEDDKSDSDQEEEDYQPSHHTFMFHPGPPTKIAEMVQAIGSWKPNKELQVKSKECEHDWKENAVTNYTICCGILTTDMSRLNCPKCQLTTCAICAKNYLGITVNVKGKQPQKLEEEKNFSNGEVKLLKELLKEKTEQVQKQEELWKSKESLLIRDLTDALKTIDQLRIEKERLEEQKDEEIKKLKA